MRKGISLYIILLLSFTIIGLTGCGDDSDPEFINLGPSIARVVPANGATDVPANTAILITFDEEVNTPSTGNLSFTPGVSGTASYDPDSYTLTFRPSADLGITTEYSLTIDGITDIEGAAMEPVTIRFTTSVPDNQRPEITFTYPEDGQKDIGHDEDMVISFSEPIDRSRFRSSINFIPEIDVDQDEWILEWSLAGDEIVTISPPPGMEPYPLNKDCTLFLSKNNVLDISGNPILVDLQLKFKTLRYPVEKVNPLYHVHEMQIIWMYSLGKWKSKWVVLWGGTQVQGGPSQNTPSGTITASADGYILEDVEVSAANANNMFTPVITKGNGNRMTWSTVNLNNNRKFKMIFTSTSKYLTFDLKSSAGTIPKQYVHVGLNYENPSRTPFTMRNRD